MNEDERKKQAQLFPQDVNTLRWPLFFPGKEKRTEKIVSQKGEFIAEILTPSSKIHLFKDVYFQKEDTFAPRSFDGKVLKYLLLVAQKERDTLGNPSKTVVTSAKEIAKAVLKKSTNPGKKIMADVLKAVVRLRYVNFVFNGTFFRFAGEKLKPTTVSFGILQSFVIEKEKPEVPITVTFSDNFYEFVVKSSFVKDVDFQVVRNLKSGIAQRLYELATVMGEGNFFFNLRDFLEKLGIFSEKKEFPPASKIEEKLKRAAKSVSENSMFNIDLNVSKSYARQEVSLKITLKEKKLVPSNKKSVFKEAGSEKTEKTEVSISPTEKKLLLEELRKRKNINSEVAVLKKMDPVEVEHELKKIKEKIIERIKTICSDTVFWIDLMLEKGVLEKEEIKDEFCLHVNEEKLISLPTDNLLALKEKLNEELKKYAKMAEEKGLV